MTFKKGQTKWVIASSLNEVIQLKSKYPAAPFIVGNTIIGEYKESRASPMKSLIVSRKNDEVRPRECHSLLLHLNSNKTLYMKKRLDVTSLERFGSMTTP